MSSRRIVVKRGYAENCRHRVRDTPAAALKRITEIHAPLDGPNTEFWGISKNGLHAGKVTSAIFSPRLEQNIAQAMLSINLSEIGTEVEVTKPSGTVQATVVETPFYDPGKKLATGA